MRACRIVRLLVCSLLIATAAAHHALAQADEAATIEARVPQLMSQGKWAEAITLAERLLEGTAAESGRDLVFGIGAGGFSGWSKAKSELNARIAEERQRAGIQKSMPSWTLHDLRRSFVTHVSEHGYAQPHVVEAIVNHVSGAKAGVAGVYNRAGYLTEKRKALEMWGTHVAALIEGRDSNVVPLRREQSSSSDR